MDNINIPKGLTDRLDVVFGVIVLLLIPFIKNYTTAETNQLMEYVFYVVIAAIVRGGGVQAFIPLLEWLAKRTPSTVDDEAVKMLKG